MSGRILFVDDEEAMREMVAIVLGKDGHEVDTASGGEEALARFAPGGYDLVIQDLKMPGLCGVDLLRRFREKDPEVPVVIVTAFSTWETAVEAMRFGAHDYLRKPFDNDDLRAMVQRALTLHRLHQAPGAAAGGKPQGEPILIGSTPEIQQTLSVVKRVAATDATVLIQGESGTGKELIARLLHLESPRRAGPFLGINCGAFAETLLESEIFGHVRGAFTGAVADKKGLLEIADGGTFFLDEVGEMSLQTQVRLLRVLETREFLPVGGTKPVRSDIRFVAATNRDLSAMVERRTFREDLFYRLNVIPLRLPPLRERREDIPLLAGHFLAQYNSAFGREIEGFEEEALRELMAGEWPGNIRELQNTVQRAVTLARGPRIGAADLCTAPGRPVSPPPETRSAPPVVAPAPGPGFSLEKHLETIEADCLRQALARTGGNLTEAAELLGMTFRSIRYRVKKLGIER